jgi:hypothetical protein
MKKETQEYKTTHAVSVVLGISMFGLVLIACNFIHWTLAFGIAIASYMPLVIIISKRILTKIQRGG